VWRLAPFDYDGVQPLEYVGRSAIVWSCSYGIGPFPLVAVDTLTCLTDEDWSGGELVDFDGDAAGDLLITEATWRGPSKLRIIHGGVSTTKGCERRIEFTFPTRHYENTVNAVWKGFDGQWYVLQNAHDEDFSRWDGKERTFPITLVLYTMTFTKQNNVWSASFEVLDSLTRVATVSGDVLDTRYAEVRVIADSNARSHYIFLDRSQYQVVDDKLKQGFAFHATYRFSQVHDLGRTLGTTRPLLGANVWAAYTTDRKSYIVFMHPDKPEAPYAILANETALGTQNGIRYTAIKDLTGDGKPEVFYSNVHFNGTLSVYVASLDSAATLPVLETPDDVMQISVVGAQLHVRVYEGQSLNIDIVNLSGQVFPLMQSLDVPSGYNAIDLSSQLKQFPHGFYNIVVRAGPIVKYFSILR